MSTRIVILICLLLIAGALYRGGQWGRGFVNGMVDGKFVLSPEDVKKEMAGVYDDVELTNAGEQLEWIQKQRGEEIVYQTPAFVYSKTVGEPDK